MNNILQTTIPCQINQTTLFDIVRRIQKPFAVLDSGMEPNPRKNIEIGRYCFAGIDPFAIFSARGERLQLFTGNSSRTWRGDPLTAVQELLNEYKISETSIPTPLPAGAIGFISYDLYSPCGILQSTDRIDPDLPHVWFAFFDAIVTLDKYENKLSITSTGLPERGRKGQVRAARRLEEMSNAISHKKISVPKEFNCHKIKSQEPVISNFSRSTYSDVVLAAKEYIAAGDVYQVNLSQRFETRFHDNPLDLFLRLKEINPAPFAAYLDCGDWQVVSSSPERFLHFDSTIRTIQTRPIKGTQSRGFSAKEDETLRHKLINSEKDHAEHVMIVDLERNDLGRVAETGSVHVRELAILESYSTVFHLTSTVEAILPPQTLPIDVIRSGFPGGSITGAPKIRAMEIIQELETAPRGIYTGTIGYLSFTGNMDLNIAIRTIVLKDNIAYFHAGAGIVADSDPDSEYNETLLKASAIANVLGISSESIGPFQLNEVKIS